jgi:pimeloyl-ACP methyl ester carboxylesterase
VGLQGASVFAGTGNGAALLLPVVYSGGYIWSQILRRLRAHFARVIIFDRAICEWNTKQSYISGYAEMLRRIIELDPEDRFVVFGNSFGGLIAIETGRRIESDNLTVVFSGCPGFTDGKDFSYGWRSREVATWAKAQQILSDLFVFPERFPAEEVAYALRLVHDDEAARRMVKALREIAPYNVKQKLGEMRCRGVAIWGTEDKITSVAPAKHFITNHSDCGFFEIKDAGHCPMMDQPGQFIDLALGSIGSLAPVATVARAQSAARAR